MARRDGPAGGRSSSAGTSMGHELFVHQIPCSVPRRVGPDVLADRATTRRGVKGAPTSRYGGAQHRQAAHRPVLICRGDNRRYFGLQARAHAFIRRRQRAPRGSAPRPAQDCGVPRNYSGRVREIRSPVRLPFGATTHVASLLPPSTTSNSPAHCCAPDKHEARCFASSRASTAIDNATRGVATSFSCIGISFFCHQMAPEFRSLSCRQVSYLPEQATSLLRAMHFLALMTSWHYPCPLFHQQSRILSGTNVSKAICPSLK